MNIANPLKDDVDNTTKKSSLNLDTTSSNSIGKKCKKGKAERKAKNTRLVYADVAQKLRQYEGDRSCKNKQK